MDGGLLHQGIDGNCIHASGPVDEPREFGQARESSGREGHRDGSGAEQDIQKGKVSVAGEGGVKPDVGASALVDDGDGRRQVHRPQRRVPDP